MKNLLIIAFVGVFALSCKKEEKPDPQKEQTATLGLIPMVIINGDTSAAYIGNYKDDVEVFLQLQWRDENNKTVKYEWAFEDKIVKYTVPANKYLFLRDISQYQGHNGHYHTGELTINPVENEYRQDTIYFK